MSQSQLYRKIKALTNLTIQSFIRMHRLKRAFEMLEQGSKTVKEVAFLTGFANVSHFSKMFAQKYGLPPSKVAQK